MVHYQIITKEWLEGQFILQTDMAVATLGLQSFGYKIVVVIMCTTSNVMHSVAITDTVELAIKVQLLPHHRQALFYLHQ